MTEHRTPGKASQPSGTKTFDAHRPVRFTEKSELHFTSGQRATLKRAARKAS